MNETGYYSALPYSVGYYDGMNRSLIGLTLGLVTNNSLTIETACELGFGQGLSIAIHSAASSSRWYGNDLIRGHVDFANELCGASGASPVLSADSFVKYCTDKSLPQFDFIAMHGVWSWIGDSDRQVILNFLNTKLNPNGILYVSYNSMPGQSALLPFRHLFNYQHKKKAEVENPRERIQSAFSDINNLLKAGSKNFSENTKTLENIEALKSRDENYLAHEYLNDSWEPMYFDRVHEDFTSVGLQFVASSNFLDQILPFSFNESQLAYLSETQSIIDKQLAIDYLTNRPFRREYWVKSQTAFPSTLKLVNIPQTTEFVQIVSNSAIKLSIKTNAGHFTLSPDIYEPFCELFSNHSIMSFADVVKIMAVKGIGAEKVGEAIGIFLGCGYISTASSESNAKISEQCFALNDHLLKRALVSSDINFFASPVTQGGVYVPRIHQLFLFGKKTCGQTEKIVKSTHAALLANKESLTREDGSIVSDAELMHELNAHYDIYQTSYLTRYQALGIVP